MGEVYFAACVDVKGFQVLKYKKAAMEVAKGMGKRWFVLPGSEVFNSEKPLELGGQRPWFTLEMAKGRLVKQYSVNWQRVEEDDGAACWLGALSKWKYNIPYFSKEIPLNEKDKHDKVEVRRWLVKRLVENNPHVEWAWEGEGQVGMLLIKRLPSEYGWGHFTRINLDGTAGSGGKVVKRVTQWFNKYLGQLKIPMEDVKIIVLRGKKSEALLDGALIWSQDLRDLVFQNLKRVYAEEKVRLPGGVVVPAIPDEVMEKMQKCMQDSIRMWVPGGKIKGKDKGCMPKGHAYVDGKGKPGLWVMVHETNLKEEVHVGGTEVRIGIVPMPGKLKGNANAIYCIENRNLFSEVGEWVQETYEKLLDDLVSGKMEDDLEYVVEQGNRGEMKLDGMYASTNMKLRYWMDLGLELKRFPKWGLETFVEMKGHRVVEEEEGNLHPRIPYCVYATVVPDLLMKILTRGWEETPGGMIQWQQRRKLLVVNNEHYVERVQRTHGGSDLDDKYHGMFRRKESGRYVVYCLRNPNGWGEWTEWLFQGDLPGKWKNEEIPVLKDTVPMSTPIWKREPKESLLEKGGKCSWETTYGLKDFLYDLKCSSGGAGAIINDMVAYDGAMRYKGGVLVDDEVHAVSSEEVIDTFTQGKHPGNVEKIKEVGLAIGLSIQQVDTVFGETRNLEYPQEDTWFSHMMRAAVENKKEYQKAAKEWVATNFVPPDVSKIKLKNRKEWDLTYCTLQNLQKFISQCDKGEDGMLTDEGWEQLREHRKEVMDKHWKEWMMDYAVYMVYTGFKGLSEKLLMDSGFFEAYAKWYVKFLEETKKEETMKEERYNDEVLMMEKYYSDDAEEEEKEIVVKNQRDHQVDWEKKDGSLVVHIGKQTFSVVKVAAQKIGERSVIYLLTEQRETMEESMAEYEAADKKVWWLMLQALGCTKLGAKPFTWNAPIPV